MSFMLVSLAVIFLFCIILQVLLDKIIENQTSLSCDEYFTEPGIHNIGIKFFQLSWYAYRKSSMQPNLPLKYDRP